jgi:uncharacterized lipoprotein YddW (UPF0748 family)
MPRRRRPTLTFPAQAFPALAALLAAALALVLALPLLVAAQPAPPEIRGVWLTLNDMAVLRDRERMRSAVADLARLHVNTLYPVVWNGGYAWYPSEVTQRRGLQHFTPRGLQGQDPLTELVAEAHGRGLLVVPWFEFGFMLTPGMELATRHPEWLSRTRDGRLTSISAAGEVSWLNPFRPEVQQLIRELVVEIVATSGADGIQFDDHMSLPSEFGYDPFTVALYKRETGRTAPADPQEPAWLQWRANKLTAFMAQLHKVVNEQHPGALVSLSPNYHDFAYKRQLQQWREWVRLGIVDELVVQLYRPDLESFAVELARPELAESRQRIPVAIGVMAGQRNRPVPIALVSAQAEAARARGLGVAFFYFETLWQRSDEPAELRQEALGRLFPEPAPRTLPPVRSRSPGNTADRPYSWGPPPSSGRLGPP